MQDENSFIPLSGAAVASKSAICCSMLPTFSGDMLFCVTSARNAVISAVSAVVSIISVLFFRNKNMIGIKGGKRQEGEDKIPSFLSLSMLIFYIPLSFIIILSAHRFSDIKKLRKLSQVASLLISSRLYSPSITIY